MFTSSRECSWRLTIRAQLGLRMGSCSRLRGAIWQARSDGHFRLQSLMRPLLTCAQDGHEKNIGDYINRVAQQFKLMDEKREQLLAKWRDRRETP
jgi:Mrr N-terminal domain